MLPSQVGATIASKTTSFYNSFTQMARIVPTHPLSMVRIAGSSSSVSHPSLHMCIYQQLLSLFFHRNTIPLPRFLLLLSHSNMSPSQFHDYHHLRRELNGPRPTPLKIHKDSHFIHKPPSSTSSSSSSSSLSVASAVAKQSQHQQRHPVIIYTQSPKIIHTQARDFMTLVQKLTGLSRSDDDPAPTQTQSSEAGGIAGQDDSSATDDENFVAPPVFAPLNHFLSEIPLFTPTPTNLFASSGPLYRYPDSVFSPTTIGKSIPPAVMETMKAFPEY